MFRRNTEKKSINRYSWDSRTCYPRRTVIRNLMTQPLFNQKIDKFIKSCPFLTKVPFLLIRFSLLGPHQKLDFMNFTNFTNFWNLRISGVPVFMHRQFPIVKMNFIQYPVKFININMLEKISSRTKATVIFEIEIWAQMSIREYPVNLPTSWSYILSIRIYVSYGSLLPNGFS